MTHSPVIIDAATLYSRIFDEGEIDSAEWIGASGLFDADGGYVPQETWWVASWPEHVNFPKYNGDVSVAGPFDSREEARDYAGSDAVDLA